MAINLTTLFTRLGRVGYVNYVANVHQAALPNALDGLFDQFTSQPDRQWVNEVQNAYNSLLVAPITGLETGTFDAQQILFEMVSADNPSAASSVPAAVQEVIRQMGVASASVATCTTGVAASVQGTMIGTGTIVVSKYRGDGLIRQNVVPENAGVVCEQDSYSGGATAGQEQFRFTGAAQTTNRLSYDWPGGSGASFPFLAINAAAAADANGNLLTNSDFETFTVPNTPDKWAIEAGTAGTQILQDTSAPYYGTSNIRFVGNATGAAISQTFGISTGTVPVPLPEVNYAVSFWGKITTAPAAGVLTVQLTDASNTVINDQSGTPNTFTLTLSTAATVWTNYTANFRFPRNVISGAKIRVRLSTALSVGSTLDIDHFAFGEMQTPYPGGPSVAVFGGAIPFARGDTWIAAVTNDRAGQLYLATWNAFIDRLFQLRENGLQLPYSGSPTISDELIYVPSLPSVGAGWAGRGKDAVGATITTWPGVFGGTAIAVGSPTKVSNRVFGGSGNGFTLPTPLVSTGPFTIYVVGTRAASTDWVAFAGISDATITCLFLEGIVGIEDSSPALEDVTDDPSGLILGRFRRTSANVFKFQRTGISELTGGSSASAAFNWGSILRNPTSRYTNVGTATDFLMLCSASDTVADGTDALIRQYIAALYPAAILY